MFIEGKKIQTTCWWLFQLSHLTRLCSSVVWGVFQNRQQQPQPLPVCCVVAFQETRHRHLHVLAEVCKHCSKLPLQLPFPHTHVALKPVFCILLVQDVRHWPTQGEERRMAWGLVLHGWEGAGAWLVETQAKEEKWKSTEFRRGHLDAGDGEEWGK